MNYYEQRLQSMLAGMQEANNLEHFRAAEDAALAGEVYGIIGAMEERGKAEEAMLVQMNPQLGQALGQLNQAQQEANLRGWSSLFG